MKRWDLYIRGPNLQGKNQTPILHVKQNSANKKSINVIQQGANQVPWKNQRSPLTGSHRGSWGRQGRALDWHLRRRGLLSGILRKSPISGPLCLESSSTQEMVALVAAQASKTYYSGIVTIKSTLITTGKDLIFLSFF